MFDKLAAISYALVVLSPALTASSPKLIKILSNCLLLKLLTTLSVVLIPDLARPPTPNVV